MCMPIRERWLSTHGESDFLRTHMMWAHPTRTRQDKTRNASRREVRMRWLHGRHGWIDERRQVSQARQRETRNTDTREGDGHREADRQTDTRDDKMNEREAGERATQQVIINRPRDEWSCMHTNFPPARKNLDHTHTHRGINRGRQAGRQAGKHAVAWSQPQI